MAKAFKEYGTDYHKRFIDGINKLSGVKHIYEVWSDLMALYAIELSNTSMRPLKGLNEDIDKVWQVREDEYIKIMKKYSKQEQKIISQMFTLMVLELDRNMNQDFLGHVYTSLNIQNKKLQQCFTPYDVAKLSADIAIDRKDIGKQVHKEGYVTINDSCCGAGAMLIASIAKLRDDVFKKYNFQNHILVIANDVDWTCVYMSYIQLSLLGVAGYIYQANTLSEPNPDAYTADGLSRIFFTPMYWSDVWAGRRLAHGQNILGRKVKCG